MYGLVNRAMQNLVQERFGEEAWNRIRENAGVDIEVFSSNEKYDDKITYSLVSSASLVLNLPVDVLLVEFGKYWVTKTAVSSYGPLMSNTGSSVREFLINLPHLHNHVKMIFPDLRPPTFQVSNLEETSLWLHYRTFRVGLGKFVEGLVLGLGELYSTSVKVRQIERSLTGVDHEVYLVEW